MSEAVIASWMLDGRAVAEQARVRAAAQALAEDDPAGLGPLYYLLADRVYGLALWISGSEAEAADTAQDTFVRVWQKRRYVAAARDPLSYVLGMARSVAIDRLRRNRLDATEGVETLLAPVLDEPERRLDAQRVSKLLLRLPLAQRVTVYLHVFAGLSFREVGRATGVPRFTAASRYRLALRKLREWLE